MSTPVIYGTAGQNYIIPYVDLDKRQMTILPDADPDALERADALNRAKETLLTKNSPNKALRYDQKPGEARPSQQTAKEKQNSVERAFEKLAKDDIYGTVGSFRKHVLSLELGYWDALLHIYVRAGYNFGVTIDYQQEIIQTPDFKKIVDLLKKFYKYKEPYFFNGAINYIVTAVPEFFRSKGVIVSSEYYGGNPKGVTRKYKYRKFNVSSKRFRTKKSTRHNKRQSRRK